MPTADGVREVGDSPEISVRYGRAKKVEKAREVVFISIMARFVAILFLLTSPLRSQLFLSDNFDGSEIDNSKWDVFLPYANSAVYVQNGVLKSKNYGFIVSKQSFSGPYSVSFVFGPLNSPSLVMKSNDQFLLRQSNLSIDPFSQVTGADGNGLIVIIGTLDLPLSNQEPYAGAETDDPFVFNDYETSLTTLLKTTDSNGTTFSEYELWPNPEAWPNSSAPSFTGTKIGFFGSSADAEASLFSVQVLSIPEPSALSLLAIGLCGLALVRRRRS